MHVVAFQQTCKDICGGTGIASNSIINIAKLENDNNIICTRYPSMGNDECYDQLNKICYKHKDATAANNKEEISKTPTNKNGIATTSNNKDEVATTPNNENRIKTTQNNKVEVATTTNNEDRIVTTQKNEEEIEANSSKCQTSNTKLLCNCTKGKL